MTKLHSYILCATPRSGSTMLCDLLEGTGVAGHPNSFYRSQDIDYWTRRWDVKLVEAKGSAAFEREFLDAVLSKGRSDNGVFGIRIMFGTLAELLDRLELLFPGSTALEKLEQAFGSIMFIHLSRLDKVAQAVSRLRAEQGGLWHRSADGTERERSGPGEAPSYDVARLAGFVDEATNDDAAWTNFFAENAIKPFRLSYETMTAAPKPDLAQILTALNQDPALAEAAVIKTAKLADATNLEWMARFRAEQGDPGAKLA